MAIKGKSKGRSAKGVTRGPKPVYQPVKKPLLARRGFWFVIAAILGSALIVGLVVGFIFERNANERDRLEARMADAASQYQGEIDPILATIGQPRPPSSYDAFIDLSAAVAGLSTEKPNAPLDREALMSTAGDTVSSAKNAMETLNAIDETQLIRDKGFSESFVLYIINSKGNFVRAMRLYQQAARLVQLAAAAQGAERAALAARAKAITSVANELFDRGYADYVEAQTQAGVFAPSQPVPGLPSPTGAS